MIVSKKHQFVFVHVPRTGGTSVRQMWQQWDPRVRTHTTYQQYVKAHPNHNAFFSFGFIRNPWERVYSLYWKHVKNSDVDTSRGFKYWMFDEGRTDSQRHKQPALHFLRGVDYIARYENFEQEWNYIFDQIGLKRIEIPHIYQFQDGSYHDQYDEEMQKFMIQHHQIDIEYGGYVF